MIVGGVRRFRNECGLPTGTNRAPMLQHGVAFCKRDGLTSHRGVTPRSAPNGFTTEPAAEKLLRQPLKSPNKQSKKCLCETSETGYKNVFYLYASSRCPYHSKLRS
jgi:hypothetical protein